MNENPKDQNFLTHLNFRLRCLCNLFSFLCYERKKKWYERESHKKFPSFNVGIIDAISVNVEVCRRKKFTQQTFVGRKYQLNNLKLSFKCENGCFIHNCMNKWIDENFYSLRQLTFHDEYNSNVKMIISENIQLQRFPYLISRIEIFHDNLNERQSRSLSSFK